MKTLDSNALKERRKAVYDGLEAMLQKAENEKREITAEEKTIRDKNLAEMRELDAEIDVAVEMEKRRVDMASIAFNKTEKKHGEENEIREYSLMKAVRGFLNGSLEGLEKEMHQEAILEAEKRGVAIVGIGIPSRVPWTYKQSERRDVVAASSTAVGTIPVGFFDSLVARTVLGPDAANANLLPNLVGNTPLPGLSTATTNVGVSTSENAAAIEGQPTIGGPTLMPKRITGWVEMSKLLLAQTSISIDTFIKNDLIRVLASVLEQQVLGGAGTAGQIKGINAVTGIGTVVGGTNGLAPSWANILSLESKVAAANADWGRLAYLMDPKIRGKLKSTEKNATGSIGNWVFGDGATPVNGYKAFVSMNIPNALTKGTSTGIVSNIIFGNFEDLVIGNWGGLTDITVDNQSKAEQALIRIIINSYWDAAPRHPESFAVMLDALNT